jgi:hypothetical protein
MKKKQKQIISAPVQSRETQAEDLSSESIVPMEIENAPLLASEEEKLNVSEGNDDEFIEEELFIIADFDGFENPKIFRNSSKNSGVCSSTDCAPSISLDNVISSNPSAVLHNIIEFKGKHEINLGSTLLFKQEATNINESTALNSPSSVIHYSGNTVNSIHFKLAHLREEEIKKKVTAENK